MRISVTKFKIVSFLIAIIFILQNSACKKYLEAVPDKSLTIPKAISELQGVLDYPESNLAFPIAGELAGDNLYLTVEGWNSFFFVDDRLAYIWDKSTDLTQDWQPAYNRIFKMNVVLDEVQKFQDEAGTNEYNNVKGSALFYRALNFYELAQVFAPSYSPGSASLPYGIPLRLASDITAVTKRSTIGETYERIIADLKEAIGLLPANPLYKTRPGKASAFGLLARTYLTMNDFNNAGKFADSCLRYSGELLNYNDQSVVNPGASTPFKRMNKEVIFHSVTRNIVELLNSKVDTNLVNKYHADDLRKLAFFKVNTDGSFQFKGSYDGTLTVTFFNGITTSEMYLTRAECYARNNKVIEAMTDLNALLLNRYVSGRFIDLTAADAQQALNKILEERRKELCFRATLRWSDLRRLNQSGTYAITITRHLGGQAYNLTPGDLRYTFLIPADVIAKSGIVQNPR